MRRAPLPYHIARHHAFTARTAATLGTVALSLALAVGLSGCGSPSATQTGNGTQSNSIAAMTAPRTRNTCLRRKSSVSTNGTFDRAQSYDSLDALIDDSDTIIVGTVRGSSTDRPDDKLLGATSHDVRVLDVVKGDVAAGDTIIVRQNGSTQTDNAVDGYPIPDTILCRADTRLLFLHTFELSDEDLADYPSQVYLKEPVTELPESYYVAGMIAGIYAPIDEIGNDGMAAGTTATFARSFPLSYDDLPDRVRLAKEPADGSSDTAGSASTDDSDDHKTFTYRFASE